jgi:2,2-dialkylglycine decarboxylase (pyruvate)
MQKHRCIGIVRGRGLLLGMEFVQYADRSPDWLSKKVTNIALDLGLSANVTGPFPAGVLRFALPLTSSEEEIDFGLSVLDESITRVVETAGN